LPFGFGSVKLMSSFGHEARAVKVFMAEGYCVKCKAKREISNGVEETMKNGRKAIKGKCPTCGTVMFKILGGKAAPAAPAAPAAAPANPPTS
jgi:Zn finger protein HypA/HybF involved in hydrogenase expression